MEVNKNTKLENSQTNWWLVGTIGHHVRQSLNKIVTFVRENFARFNNRYKSLFSRATTTKSDKILGLKRKSTESSRNERGNGTIQSARQNVQKNSRIGDSTKGINFDKEESHKEINIKEDNYKPLNDLKGLDFKGPIFEVINPILINPILKNPNGEREISNKHVEFDTKVAVLLFDEEESPAEPQNKVKSFKEIDFSDKGREENKGMIRKSSYEVADEFKSFKGSDLKKSFIQIGGKVIKKSK